METSVYVRVAHVDVLHVGHLTPDRVELLRRLTHMITVLHTHTHTLLFIVYLKVKNVLLEVDERIQYICCESRVI